MGQEPSYDSDMSHREIHSGSQCPSVMSEVTRILEGIQEGDPKASDELLPLVYLHCTDNS